MDTRTGEITEREELRKSMGDEAFEQHAIEVNPNSLSRRRRKELALFGRTRVGRNERCPCGSGKKFKKCCLFKLNTSVSKGEKS